MTPLNLSPCFFFLSHELYSLCVSKPVTNLILVWWELSSTQSTNLIQARPCFSSQTSSNYILIKSPHDTLCLHHLISISSNLLHFVANQAPGCWALTDALISPVLVSYLWAINTCQFVRPFYFFSMNWMGPRDRFDMFLCSTQLYLFTCCIWLPVITIWHHNIHVRIIPILMHHSRAKDPHPSYLRTQISLSSSQISETAKFPWIKLFLDPLTFITVSWWN